jgi:ribosomal protein S18 acetylase RimI-like enzyme
VSLRPLARGELGAAAELLGRGMRDNPLHVAVFGADPSHREAALIRFLRPVVRQIAMKGRVLGAFRDATLVGVCAMTLPGRCRATPMEKMRITPAVVMGNPPRVLRSVLSWTSAWAKRDPAEAHWHLGPVAVDRDAQRRGIGGLMLAELCRAIDSDAACRLTYLETDKRENVTFYEKHGFAVTGREELLGVANWYMERRRGVAASALVEP